MILRWLKVGGSIFKPPNPFYTNFFCATANTSGDTLSN